MAKKGETLVLNKIRDYIKQLFPEAFIYKVYGSGFAKKGVPDLLICIKGRFVALEIKDPKNKSYGATGLQLQRIKEIQKAGGVAHVVESIEETEEVLIEYGFINKESRVIPTPKESNKKVKGKKEPSSSNGTRNRKNSSNDKKNGKASKTRKNSKDINCGSKCSSSELGIRVKNFLE